MKFNSLGRQRDTPTSSIKNLMTSSIRQWTPLKCNNFWPKLKVHRISFSKYWRRYTKSCSFIFDTSCRHFPSTFFKEHPGMTETPKKSDFPVKMSFSTFPYDLFWLFAVKTYFCQQNCTYLNYGTLSKYSLLTKPIITPVHRQLISMCYNWKLFFLTDDGEAVKLIVVKKVQLL